MSRLDGLRGPLPLALALLLSIACGEGLTNPAADLVSFSVDTVDLGDALSGQVELSNETDGPLGAITLAAGGVTFGNGAGASGLVLSVSPMAIPSLPMGSGAAVDIIVTVQPDAVAGSYSSNIYALIGPDTAAVVTAIFTLTPPPTGHRFRR